MISGSIVLAGQLLGTAFACGLNLYATVALLGIAARVGLTSLPPGMTGLSNGVVIGSAAALYIIEFVIDRTPVADHVWEAVHTIIRPAAAALLACGDDGRRHRGVRADEVHALLLLAQVVRGEDRVHVGEGCETGREPLGGTVGERDAEEHGLAGEPVAGRAHVDDARAVARDAHRELEIPDAHQVVLPDDAFQHVDGRRRGKPFRRQRRRAEEPLPTEGPEAGERADGGLERLAVQRAVAALPEPQRAVFVLKEIEGYSHTEIGSMLGISAGSAATRLSRAWARLRKELGT